MEWTAEEIRRRRLAHGLKQDGLAAQLGVSRSVVNKWESGKRFPSGASIRELNRVLGGNTAATRAITLEEATDVELLTELLNRRLREAGRPARCVPDEGLHLPEEDLRLRRSDAPTTRVRTPKRQRPHGTDSAT